jgi:hypothetical protein
MLVSDNLSSHRLVKLVSLFWVLEDEVEAKLQEREYQRKKI